ncbi:MAG TPA: amidohydrolase family protein [bacterium]|jgi:predicted TIM-barrel fold metal-dependent hydrolase
MDELPIVDAHQHFWDPRSNHHPWLCDEPPIPFRYGDYRALRRPYLPPDYRRDSTAHRVLKSVYVEAEWDPRDPLGETRWVEGLAAQHGLPSAIVAQAWLHREDAAAVLAGQAACPLVRGVRHKPASAPAPGEARRGAPGSLDDPRWRAGYALLARHRLSFDLQTPWWHLDAAAELARDFPATQIVLNHTGLPSDRSAEGLAAWRRALERLAAQPNVALKISGLGQPGLPWTVEANGPVVRTALAVFGVERCLFASNFPVDGLLARFDTIYAGFKAIVASLPPEQQRTLFHDNAVRVYRLGS